MANDFSHFCSVATTTIHLISNKCFIHLIWYSDNCLPVRVRVLVRIRVSLRVGGNQATTPEKNRPLVRVRVCVWVSFGVGGNFFPGNCPRTHNFTTYELRIFSSLIFIKFFVFISYITLIVKILKRN